MMGIEMMLKGMGIDPNEIKKAVGEFGAVILDIRDRLERIEAKLDAQNAVINPDDGKTSKVENGLIIAE